MSMANKTTAIKIKWLPTCEEHDYPAASSYLSLIYDSNRVERMVEELRKAHIVRFAAKDIFRASGLSLLGISNSHVKADQDKIKSGRKISPLLLVRDTANGQVIIADGYHRLCAIYSLNEDVKIPCKIV
jgi:disulfide oxidoreductase YuzD